MLTLLLPASEIPDDTIVRKVTGQVKYTLKREIKIHGAGCPPIKQQNCVFLMGKSGINCHPETTLLAVDFPHTDDLQEFIDLHLVSHQ